MPDDPNKTYRAFDPTAWIEGLTAAQMGAIECGTRLLFPDAFRRMGPKGEAILDQCLVRLPIPEDRDLATIDAIEFLAARFAKKKRLASLEIATVEDAKRAIGPVAFDELENYAILSRCTYEPPRRDAPLVADQLPAQFMTLDMMRETYSAQTVSDMLRRIEVRNFVYNPGLSELSESDFWTIVEVMGGKRSISPFGVMQGAMQLAFAQRMAEELCNYRMHSSASPSMTTSTPG